MVRMLYQHYKGVYMATILVGNEKGGVGKTLLSCNLVVLSVLAGKDSLLVDMDNQTSSSFWASIRPDDLPVIPCVHLSGEGVKKQLLDLEKRYTNLILDCGATDSHALRAGLVVADIAVIPTRTSQVDLWCASTMDELVDTAKGFNPELRAMMVINNASTHASQKGVIECKEALQDLEHMEVCKTIVRNRVSFENSFKLGLGVVELSPVDKKACDEIQSLYNEVFTNE
jgi:chromosome partitioning protein